MASPEQQTLPLFGDQPQQPLLMLMDGHAMVHRSFRAISAQRHLTVSATGEDVTGVYGFINVFLRIAPGRSFEVRKAAGEKLFQALCEYLEPIYSSSPLAISYEIQELDADLRWKKNNLREYLAAREKEK